jgi:TolB-like protein
LSGDEGTAHMIMSQAYLLGKDYDNAIAEGQRSIELNPNSSEAHNYYGLVLRYAERYNDAIPIIERAIRLNPVMPDNYYSNLAFAYNGMGQYQKAIAIWNEVVKRNPDFLHAHVGLTVAYYYSDNLGKARESAANIMRIKPDYYLSVIKNRSTMRDGKEKDRIIVALEKSGIPEYPPNTKPEKPTIAVLPFENMSNDPDQAYFSDGISEDIIIDLSKISGLIVIARNSSFSYKGKSINVQQIGQELRVRYLLEGSVRKAGSQVRINAQLIDATSGHHLWADRYDGDMSDIFTLQDKITSKIISALALKLTASQQKAITDKGTNNLQAYDEYLKGWQGYRLLRLNEL